MADNRKGLIEKIIYNNKLLMLFCIVISIVLWATVKINYSAETTRTISDVKVTVVSNTDSSDLVPFIGEDELLAEVVISGKAYNINSYAFSKDDIVVEATGGYIDSSGYKVLNLSVKASETGDLSDVKITSVTPSTISVYYDRKTTQAFNVEARLTNDLSTLVDGEYTVGQPVPSMSTVEVTGPATVLNKMTKVYFEATVVEEDIPLQQAKVISADIGYELESKRFAQYLTCEGIDEETNPATVTIPVYITRSVPTQVKFINQPSYYTENLPTVKISPSEIELSYNPVDSKDYEFLTVGTIDFRTLSDEVNEFTFPVDDSLKNSNLKLDFTEYEVTVDLSSMSRKTFDITNGKVVLLNQNEEYTYSVNAEKSNFDSVVVIGPKESLEKITADDIQVEINVSGLNVQSRIYQNVEVSNISIVNEEINDCWIYGKYKAAIIVARQ